MTTTAAALSAPAESPSVSAEFLTITIRGQLFGIPVLIVQDVLGAQRITKVPLAPAAIAGVLNLRGRIVTAVCLRRRLGRPVTFRQDREGKQELVAVGIDHEGEAYALIVDAVGEVMRLDQSTFEPVPVHLDRGWAALATGVHRLEDRLLVVLDVDAILAIELDAAA